MQKTTLAMAITLALMLTACGKPQATCSDDASRAALESGIRENLTKIVLDRSKGDDGKYGVGGSKIRAAIADLKLVIENIRTTKEDPNSTRRFCTGNLKVVFGTQVFTDADKAREIAGMPNLETAADDAGIEKGVDYLKGDLDYSVQPTDDGTKVVAEFEAKSGKLDVFGEVLAASLLRSLLENKQRIEQETEAMAEKEKQDAMNAANRASIEEATLARRGADAALGEIWKALGSATRQQLLAGQRAWIKRKDASCKVQGLQGSTDHTEQQVVIQNCIASETRSRTSELQGYLSEEPAM